VNAELRQPFLSARSRSRLAQIPSFWQPAQGACLSKHIYSSSAVMMTGARLRLLHRHQRELLGITYFVTVWEPPASRSSSRPMSSANANRNYVIDADTDDSDFAEWGWWSRLRRILSGVLLYFSCINKIFTFYVWVGGTGCTKDLYKFLHIQNRQYCRIHQRDSTSSEAARAATFTDTVNVQCQNSPVYRG
jgi:hypothetical protein